MRSLLFWPHLVSGVLAGLVIAVMSLTGVALAFAPQLLARADRQAREVAAPAPGAQRLPVDALVARAKAERPGMQVSGVTLYPDATSAVLVSSGRTEGVYVNPYTGALQPLGAEGLRATLHTLEEWHRYLGAGGESRAVGKAVTGASNALFLFLALSGLYLWWPRRWSRAALRSTLWFRGGLRGKARDFNWHNTLGFWMLPVLVVLTASGVVMSYRWASNLVFTLAGSPVPAAGGPGAAPAVPVHAPPPGTQLLALDAAFARAAREVPAWESVTLRLGGAPQAPRPEGGGERGASAGSERSAPGERADAARSADAPRGEGTERRAGAEPRGGEPRPGASGRGPQALTFSVRERDAWPRFSSVQLSLDPFTGAVLKREGYADGTAGRRARTWLRFLHTGEALGLPGQLLAALASLGAAFLVWTGLALAWRRFFPRRRAAGAAASAAAPSADSSDSRSSAA
ncbi:PepSY domain-containing protein [Aggregicoccus sp. 17bor-14]|nr:MULTISPECIES: PepSY-associated TM helix domain-containing protein [Myxococcaceae]MBF5042957.1 PepSY domain-containing protein [Simulacricoccus sp. 17bor-14]MRI88723.1 PepSY domain-containing protein [Aggregicoccus sp. 17bor-14]